MNVSFGMRSTWTDGAAESRVLCIRIKDRGKGIAPEDRERIFEMRQRADGQRESGAGVGLPLARRLARRLGGDVQLVDSAVNQGSTFEITFPYSAGDQVRPDPVTSR